MNKWKKILIGASATLLVLIIVFSIIAYLMLRKSLPEYNGKIKAEGLVNQVEILRDNFAIPLIKAVPETPGICHSGPIRTASTGQASSQ